MHICCSHVFDVEVLSEPVLRGPFPDLWLHWISGFAIYLEPKPLVFHRTMGPDQGAEAVGHLVVRPSENVAGECEVCAVAQRRLPTALR